MDFSLDYDLLVYHVKAHCFLTLPQAADYQLLFKFFFPLYYKPINPTSVSSYVPNSTLVLERGSCLVT